MMRNTIITMLLGFTLNGFSQGWPDSRYDHWYVGAYEYDFSQFPVVGFTQPSVSGQPNSIVMCDRSTGDPLFWMDGTMLWDNSNNWMANGIGVSNGTGTSLVVPRSQDTYFLFCQQWDGLLHYSVVDMSLNNGLGDVVPGMKNIPVMNNAAAMSAFSSTSLDTTWIVAPQHNTGSITSIPVVGSVVGTGFTSGSCGLNYPMNEGRMKNDRSNTRFAVVRNQNFYSIELYRSNRMNGHLNDRVTIGMPIANGPVFDIELSPSGQFAYVAQQFGIIGNPVLWQLDLSTWDSTAIDNSKTVIYAQAMSYIYGQLRLQLGPDDRIYGTTIEGDFGADSLFTALIPFPDLPGAACGFDPKGFYAGPTATTSPINKSPNLWWPGSTEGVGIEEGRINALPAPFPNPVNSGTSLQVGQYRTGATALWSDAAGRVLFRSIISEGQVRVPDLPRGLYLLSISNVLGAPRNERIMVH